MQIQKFTLLFLISFSFSHGAITISGVPNTAGQPFPFPVQALAYDRGLNANNQPALRLFIGANQVTTVPAQQAQAISTVQGAQTAVTGITPATTTVNGQGGQPNPLYGQKINFLAISDSNPFVVTAAANNIVYYLQSPLAPNAAVYSTPVLVEAGGVPVTTINGLTGLPGSTENVTITDGGGGASEVPVPTGERFFAAVDIGTANGGIAAGSLHITKNPTPQSGQALATFALLQDQFLPLTTSSPAIAITNPLASLAAESMVSYTFPQRIPVYFTGLQVVSGAAGGAISVTLNGNGSIVVPTAIQTDSIIGTTSPNTTVSAFFLDTLYTSTQLDYLIVVGGVGSTSPTTVYALPLTQSGFLAAQTATPTTLYTKVPGTPNFFQVRFISDALKAVNPGDLYTSTSYQAQVGNGSALPGPITALFGEKDTVFVAVGSNSATDLGGIFYSQALFTASGTIMGWTNWRRAGDVVQPVFGMAFDNTTSLMWFFPGTSASDLTLLEKVQWNLGGLSGFDQAIQSAFAVPTGTEALSFQGLFDFNRTNPAFNQTVGSRFSMMVATGYQQVLLLQSGADVGTLFTPVNTITSSFASTSGALTSFVPGVQEITITGGVLDAIGPIITSEVVSDGTYSWLLVGGSGGMAVLANPDGSGWAEGSLTAGFAGLAATLAFKPLFGISQVRKIIADGATVYVLTTNALYRFTASAAAFSTQMQQPTILALTSGGLSGVTYSDVAISGPLALLATSVGLFVSGNGQSIATATNSAAVGWQPFALPESPGPVTRLFVICPTATLTDFAKTNSGGNIYLMSAAVGAQQARLYRLSIQGLPLTGGQVTSATCTLFNDQFVEGSLSTYLNVGDYRNYLATDGASLFLSRSAYYPTKVTSYMQIVNPTLRTGVFAGIQLSTALFNEPRATPGGIIDPFIPNRIGPWVQRSATGSWMVAGSNMFVQA